MVFDLEKAMKEHEDGVGKTVSSEDFIFVLDYESEKIYRNLLIVRDVLKDIHFVNSWKPIDVFFNIIQERIDEVKAIDRKIYYYYYERGGFDSNNTPNLYRLCVESFSICSYLAGIPYEYSIEIDIMEASFDSNEFLNTIINKIESISKKTVYYTLDYLIRYNVEKLGEKAVFSLLSVDHIAQLIDMHLNTMVYPYLGESELQQLNTALVDKVSIGKKLAIERGKNFISGNNALVVKMDDKFLGYLPKDFNRFLCPGIESGYIKYEARITEIETNSFKATKKYMIDKKNTSKKKNDYRVCVELIVNKGDKA